MDCAKSAILALTWRKMSIVDIEPDEAKKLLRLIEMLLDKWYITRHEEEDLLNEIVGIAKSKEEQRK